MRITSRCGSGLIHAAADFEVLISTGSHFVISDDDCLHRKNDACRIATFRAFTLILYSSEVARFLLLTPRRLAVEPGFVLLLVS